MKDEISVTSIGCGPGTDLLGLLKARYKRNRNVKIIAHMLDCERGWEDTFNGFLAPCSELNSLLTVGPVITLWHYLDVNDKTSWGDVGKYTESDLFVISYMLSEACRSTTQAPGFFPLLFNYAKSGATFLFVDNNSPAFTPIYKEIEDIGTRNSLKGLQFKAYDDNWYPPQIEQIQDISPYPEKLKNRPLMRGNFVYAVGIKQ